MTTAEIRRVRIRGVAALAEQRNLLLYRTAAHLAFGYAYVTIIQWGARQIEDTDA